MMLGKCCCVAAVPELLYRIMKLNRVIFVLTLFVLLMSGTASAQLSRLIDTLEYRNEITGTLTTKNYSPIWMANNKFGLSEVEGNSAVWRRQLSRSILNDENRNWRVGYGLDWSSVYGKNHRTVLQQGYLDVQYKKVGLSIGLKERTSEMLDRDLSSGGLVTGMNARPIPQVRFELPDFWAIPGTNEWLALKAHIAYGMYTDNGWQSDFTKGTNNLYSKNSLYHTKAGYLRVGNKYEFPITFTAGLEMNTQFAGTAYNVKKRADDQTGFKSGTVKMPHNFKAFWNAFVPGGSDATDAGYNNAEGNTVGAWHFSIDIHGIDWAGDEMWKARAYAEHMFEDHSQLFVQYGWKDWLLGAEFQYTEKALVNGVVYEFLTLKDQSGPIYHDATTAIPDQVSAIDNYYNHGVYGAWQHAGYGLGNALVLSPVYNPDGSITFKHNRIQAHHFGLKGHPIDELAYRLMFSYEKSWGTYFLPLTDPKEGWTMLVEATYMPKWLRNFSFTLAYGHNGGKLFKTSDGFQLGAVWQRKFHKKNQAKE